MIDDLAQALRDDDLIIHSKTILNELSVFAYNDNGTMSAPNSYHDDCVMALAIAVQAAKNIYTKKLDQLDYLKYLPS
jgi:hypothetical protein